MATKQKQTSSASLDAALIKGEYNAGKSGSYRTVNLGLANQFKSKNLLAAAQSQKAANDKIHSDLKNHTGFQADLQKVTGDDVGVIQNQMYANKTEIAEIYKRMQNGSPEDKIIGEQQIAVLKNGAATLNGYMEDVFNLKAEYRENVKLGKMSNVTDPNKSKQLAQALGQDGGYQLILNGNNPPTYKLKDGTILTHDELDDFAIKDDAIGMEIVDEAEAMMDNGKQGKTFNEKDQSMYKNKLTRTLTPQQVESLIYDDLIDGQSFITAMGSVSPDASFEEKREAVATALVQNMAEVHKVGLDEYNTKQSLTNNPSSPRVKVGEIQQFAGRNGVQYIWYPELGGYGVAQKRADGGYAPYSKNDTNYYPKDNAIIKNPNILNMQMVGDKVQFEN
jgi:hypothetical protein